MMPLNRVIPVSGLSPDNKYWDRVLDSSQRVAVYFPSGPDSVTLIGYYNSVSAANAAATATIKNNGALPTVAVNWWHSTIAQISTGMTSHPDARVALPSWIDA